MHMATALTHHDGVTPETAELIQRRSRLERDIRVQARASTSLESRLVMVACWRRAAPVCQRARLLPAARHALDF